MRKEIDISLISKYRSVLMGVALLWIILRHSPIDLTSVPFVLRFISRSAVGGVDLFFFLSGLGVYFSYKNSSSIKEFYKKRVLRIFPYAIPIALFFALFFQYPNGEISIAGIFTRFFMLEYWLENDALGWFLPVVSVFYLLSPVFIRFMSRDGFKWRTCFALMIACYLLGLVIYHTVFKPANMNDMTHMAVYILGIQAGYLLGEKKKVNLFWLVTIFIVGAILCLIHYRFWPDSYCIYMFFNVLPFVFMVFPLSLLLSYLFSFAKGYKYPILSFIGSYTLTIYILYERILLVLDHYHVPYHIYVGFALTILLAYIWQNLVSLLVSKIVK